MARRQQNTSSNLCPECGASLATSQKGWVYCPNKYSSRNCSFKGYKAQGGGMMERAAEITPLANPSEEQSAILRWAETVKAWACALVLALAGTGKTTILVQLVRVFLQRGVTVLALAFARRDKEALEARAPGAKVLTSNGAGYGILAGYVRSVNGGRLDIKDGLGAEMLDHRLRQDGIIGPEGSQIKGGTFGAILQLVDKARSCILYRHPQEPSNADFQALMDRFDIEIDPKDYELALFYATWLFKEMASLQNLASRGQTDFAGQVFLPIYHRLLPSRKYNIVLVDECQDQNPYNRELAFLYCEVGGRVIAVGDEHQAIYAWRGADEFAVGEMERRMTEHCRGIPPVTFPLTLCRRCARLPLSLAQQIVPEIQPLPDAPDGEIGELENAEELFTVLCGERKGLVLSRVNAPLISLCLKLLAVRVPAVLARGNVVQQLLNLIDQLSEHNGSLPIDTLLERLRLWEEDKLAKLAACGQYEKKAEVVKDKAECLRALADEESVKDSLTLKRKIDELFPNDWESRRNGIVLSTVHGAKGGEAHTVYLYSTKTASGASVFDAVWSSARDRDNTLYVALTRAEYKTVIVGPKPSLERFSDGVLDGNLEDEE